MVNHLPSNIYAKCLYCQSRICRRSGQCDCSYEPSKKDVVYNLQNQHRYRDGVSSLSSTVFSVELPLEQRCDCGPIAAQREDPTRRAKSENKELLKSRVPVNNVLIPEGISCTQMFLSYSLHSLFYKASATVLYRIPDPLQARLVDCFNYTLMPQ